MLDGEDILVVTDGFWDAPKRLRHKMPIKWAEAGCRVLWLEQPPFPFSDWQQKGRLKKGVVGTLTGTAKRLWVGSMPPATPFMYKGGLRGDVLLALQRPLFFRRLNRYLKQLDFDPRLVVLFQQAARWDVFERFPNAKKIYYHHDVYGYGHATAGQLKTLETCCRKADMIWCVSKAHRDELREHNENVHHIPHAVDVSWWEAYHGNVPQAYRDISRPRVVYTGVFQEKIDLPLLIAVSRRRPEWRFVFVGPVQPKNLDGQLIETLQKQPNTHFLGQRDVNEIPGFLAGADLLMLPYAANENTRTAGLALKFYEYLISGKPIVTTPFTELEVEQKGLFDIAETADEWCAVMDRCRARNDEVTAKRRTALARENTYDARLELQRRLLRELG